MTQHEINEREWNNPANWTWAHSFYHSKRDTRVIVPKWRRWAGWTFNFAHQGAWWCMVAILSPAVFVLLACVAAGVGR